MPLLSGVPHVRPLYNRHAYSTPAIGFTTYSWRHPLFYLFLGLITIHFGTLVDAQVTAILPTNGGGSLGTTVTPASGAATITGGTRPNGGTNLFHSFHEFSVGTSHIANFLNEAALPTTNILSRVTGGQVSSIYGTIQTTGFDGAHFFLMNPAGIVFGPSASLNVGGSVTFTTADYVRLIDGVRFEAVPGAQDAVLSAAPVTAFGFLGTNPAGITVEGSSLAVLEGQALSLIGGNIAIQAGALEEAAHLTAAEGQIRLSSVASSGEVLHSTFEASTNFQGEAFSDMGTIAISGHATLDASGDAGGSVKIRGGQLVIADSTLSADTNSFNGAPMAIDINVTGTMSIADTRAAPSISARTFGSGDAGEVKVVSATLDATSSVQEAFAVIDTHTSGEGRAGKVDVTTGDLRVNGPDTTLYTFIDSGTRGPGDGNDVSVTANAIDLSWTTITTGDFMGRRMLLEPSGSAGNLTITADRLKFDTITHINTEAFAAFVETQQGGDLTFNVREINVKDSRITSGGMAGGDIIFNDFDMIYADFTSFQTWTDVGNRGRITATGSVVELTNGSSFISTTFGDGNAGGISLIATDHILLSGRASENPNPLSVFSPTGLFSNSFGDVEFGDLGSSGSIQVTTPRLVMSEGGRINSITQSAGNGGNVTINADVLSISGEFTSEHYSIRRNNS